MPLRRAGLRGRDLKSMQTIAVIDFETTGMSPAQGARATEVAAVLVQEGQIVGRFQSLMNSGAWVLFLAAGSELAALWGGPR